MANTPTYIKNFYTFQIIEVLKNASGSVFGQSIATFEVYKRRDVTNLNSFLGYILLMKQRIIIPNLAVEAPGPTSSTSYLNYPAILLNEIDITVNNNGTVQLQKLFPKTLNSSVSLSSSNNSGSTLSTSQQNSTGSTSTNVNTFEVGISGGFFGPAPMGSLSLGYSHSWEHGTQDSNTNGSSSGSDSNAGFGESMSIKDWSSYGYLGTDNVSPRWVWGQSYPWDVILFNQSSDGTTINLPTFVTDRMINGTVVLPPSQLSLFGTDFTMQAGWLIDFPAGVTGDEKITIDHNTQSFNASHQISGGTVSATLQNSSQASQAKYSSGPIDLSTFSLNPIIGTTDGSGAAIGFAATPFTYAPTSYSTPFKIVSPANNLQVTGSGFDATMTSNLSVATSMLVTFKITDISVDYSLLLMHWIGASSCACKLSWKVNGNYTGTLYVEGKEGNGGQNNMSTIDLRNTDFTSINFHDYLVIGTNQITIDMVAADTTLCTYTLFALAIGQA